MSYQRVLLRLLTSRRLRGFGQRILRQRVWTIEGGEGVGLKVRFPQNLDYISGLSEVPVQKALAQHVRPGDVCYDVGANVGFFSLVAAKLVGSAGCVCSFEPVAENAASIRENVRLNDLLSVRIFEVAVGGQSGSAEFFLTDWDGGGTLSTSAVKASEPVSKRAVRVVALDEFIPAENLRRPNFVKIDVEGVELEVIKGMSKTIAESKPVLLYEVDDGKKDSFDRRWKELDDHVAALGYRIEHLKASYPNTGWHVGHSLALPK